MGLGQILLHRLIRFQNIDSQDNQVFAFEFFPNVIHQLRFLLAIFTPGSPELEQDNFALDRLVVELFAGNGFGAEAWRRVASLVVLGERGGTKRYQCQGDCGNGVAAHDAGMVARAQGIASMSVRQAHLRELPATNSPANWCGGHGARRDDGRERRRPLSYRPRYIT